MGRDVGWAGARHRRATRTWLRAAVLVVIVTTVATPAVVALDRRTAQAGAAYAPTVVTTSPSPPIAYEPFTLSASGSGCAPDAEVSVYAGKSIPTSDIYADLDPRETKAVLTDGTGGWSATWQFPIAYPGSWRVFADCNSETGVVEIEDPGTYQLGVDPGAVRAGVRTTVTVTGSGCRGSTASAIVGPVPIAFGATAPVANDGSWSADVYVTIEPTFPVQEDGTVLVWAVCRFSDGVQVVSTATTHLVVIQDPPTTTTTTTTRPPGVLGETARPASAVGATPAFTG